MGANAHVTALSLDNVRASGEGLALIARALAVPTCAVRVLCLSEERLSERACEDLARSLAANRSATAVTLRNLELTDAMVVSVARALRTCGALTRLHLEGATVRHEGARWLSSAVFANTTLTDIALPGNAIADAEAASLMAMMAVAADGRRGVTALDLSHNRIAEAARHIGGLLMLSTTLTSLNLRYNGINIEGVLDIADGLDKSTVRARVRACVRVFM